MPFIPETKTTTLLSVPRIISLQTADVVICRGSYFEQQTGSLVGGNDCNSRRQTFSMCPHTSDLKEKAFQLLLCTKAMMMINVAAINICRCNQLRLIASFELVLLVECGEVDSQQLIGVGLGCQLYARTHKNVCDPSPHTWHYHLKGKK